MGEVYRARDTRLGRDVALKVLPEEVAGSRTRLARFEREAKLLAALNHPHIAAIHGLEGQDGAPVLVMELVEGSTLTARLRRGPLPLREALEIARQTASALEAAHDNGIIHRDLKPGNVMLTREGRVKLLDFGLAKAFEPETPPHDFDSETSTRTAPTETGVVLGTAPYMSPEQARGEAVDKRTDVWSFGCVVFELLSGRRAFAGATASDAITAILERDPDWSALPGKTPESLRSLLRRCLQKDEARRLHDIADARIEIEDVLSESDRPRPAGAPAIARRQSAGLWVLAGLLFSVVGIAWVAVRGLGPRATPAARRGTRLAVVLPPADTLTRLSLPAVALSPDGTRIVYSAERGAERHLYLRSLARDEAIPIPGTAGGEGPFFSPDGEWVAFFAGGKLRKVSLTGGAPVTLCDAPTPRGGSWGEGGTIFFVPRHDGTGVWRVEATGGTPVRVTSPRDDELHRWPEILPGGKALLFTIRTGTRYAVALQVLETGERKTLLEGSCARHAASGHLVFAARSGSLMAAPFDLARLEVSGPVVPVIDNVAAEASGAAHFAISQDGSLVFAPSGPGARETTLLWVQRDGSIQSITDARRIFHEVSLSPDGRRLVVTIAEGDDAAVWVYDLARGTFTRLTLGAGWNGGARWTPDGKRLAFSSNRRGPMNLFWQPADGSRDAEPLLPTRQEWDFPGSWSPDGRVLAFGRSGPETNWDIWMLRMQGDPQPHVFIQTPFLETGPAFSPDGRWLAYESDESGRNEVYVRPFPGPGGKSQVSTEGGTEPVWARNGRELFYRNGRKMMTTPLTTAPEFAAGKPKVLFEGRALQVTGPLRRSFDVAPDGTRFVMIQEEESLPQERLDVVLGFFEELRARVRPSGRSRR